MSSDRAQPELLPSELPADPMPLAAAWLEEAARADLRPNPNAMCVATLGPDGMPSARTLLCKNFVADPGYLVFYTNYRSRKARELEANPRAAAVFHWDRLGRQLRLEGEVRRSPPEESDAYFATRHWRSQLNAWASDQSEPLASRDALFVQARERAAELGVELDAGLERTGADAPLIPRPPHWGGYRLWASAVELWVSGEARAHDRARWTRALEPEGRPGGYAVSRWTATRLQP